jgi:putative membrane protein
LVLTAASVVLSVALAACNRSGGAPPEAANSASNAVVSSNPAVAGAEDATAAGVGAATAALPTSAQDFVTAAAISDMYEIAAAKIALKSSTNPDVKKFATRMIHDHTQSTDKLKKLLGGAVAASPPESLDERRKGLIANLEAAKPADFDKTYIDQQVAAHEAAQSAFQNYARNGDNSALEGFAADVLPVIGSHMEMAKQIQGELK